MAAPTPTARTTPSGVIIPEGFKGLITFARLPAASFWEKAVTPASIDGGEKIDITTMHNNRTRVFAPRTLYTPGEATVKCGFDAKFKDQARRTLINAEDTITETFPDGSTYCYYGYLQKAELGEMSVDGGFPEATLTIVQTNYDPVNRVEAEAVLTEVVGT